MKVARTIESFYPFVSGPANQAFAISRYAEKKGIESPIFTTYYGTKNAAEEERIDNVKVKRFKSIFSIMRYIVTPSIGKELDKGYDVFHAHNYRCFQTDIAVYKASKNKKPIILNAHGSLTGFKKTVSILNKVPYTLYDLLIGKRVLKKINKIIVNSREEYDNAIAFGIPSNKLEIIPFGIDCSRFDFKRTFRDDKIKLLFVGNISRNRNIEPIIEAVAKLPEKYSLTVVGSEMKSSSTLKSGYIAELMKLAENSNVSDRVKFVGPKYGEKLIDEYKSADIFVYTSLSENFGQTIMEAAAAGLPMVVTAVGIAREIIEEGINGHIVDFQNSSQIANKILMLENVDKRMKISEKILAKVKDEYELDKIMEKYIKIYKEIS